MSGSTCGIEARFLDELERGRFLLPSCESCTRRHFPPRAACPYCGSARITLAEAIGRGVVYSTTTVRRKPEDGGDHNVSIVDLSEGPRLMTSVVDCSLDGVRIGMSVRLDRRSLREGKVVFRPE
jgi:uncharacterized OB-fold protein